MHVEVVDAYNPHALFDTQMKLMHYRTMNLSNESNYTSTRNIAIIHI